MFEMIGFVMVQVFLLMAGTVLGIGCLAFVLLLTRRVGASRRKWAALAIAFVFPILALFYIEAGLFAHAIVRYGAGKDNFVEGMYHYPLANGYRLTFFDENPADWGWMEISGGQTFPTGTIHGVQIAGDYLFVHCTPDTSSRTGTIPQVTVSHGDPVEPVVPKPTDKYLEIDTRTSVSTDHSNIEELRSAAASRGATLQLMTMG